jgi:hypothetical protein
LNVISRRGSLARSRRHSPELSSPALVVSVCAPHALHPRTNRASQKHDFPESQDQCRKCGMPRRVFEAHLGCEKCGHEAVTFTPRWLDGLSGKAKVRARANPIIAKPSTWYALAEPSDPQL